MKYNKYIDHTILKADATEQDIKKLCDEAKKYEFKAICINPTWIEVAKKELKGTGIEICTVIGFPLGQMSTESKICEAKNAIELGATEVDMVINVGWAKEGNFDKVEKEIMRIKKEAVSNLILKVIIETALLTKEEILEVTKRVKNSGADFVKTSTGFSTRGASFEDIKLMKSVVGDSIEIKAAGGISTIEDLEKMIENGATRIGTSRGVSFVDGKNKVNKKGY